jgi:uncharacterized protein (DUF2141 family)
MMRCMALLGVSLACGQPASAGQIVATITGVHNGTGLLRIAICPQADFLKPHCPYTGHAPAQVGSVVITIDGIPPGIYAAQAYQDENDNGRLDRNWLGLPTEGIGFSNDAQFYFGPPAFADSAFKLTARGGAISFPIRYHRQK